MEERMDTADRTDTTDRVKVTIDWDRVAKNLRVADGSSAGSGTVRSFMLYAGFNLDEDGKWVGPRADLHRFNPGELVGVDPLNDRAGHVPTVEPRSH
jgi:hypothetical protein